MIDNSNYVSLEEILLFRDKKQLLLDTFCKTYPDCITVSLSLNIPGPEKNNEKLKRFFEKGIEKIEEALIKNENKIIEIKKLENKCGNIAFFIMKGSDVKEIKKHMIAIEEKEKAGRLFDIDVYNAIGQQISRRDMMISERKCLICENNAKACARNRTHSMSELQHKIEEILMEYNA